MNESVHQQCLIDVSLFVCMDARIACQAVRLDPVSGQSEHSAKRVHGAAKSSRAAVVATVPYARLRGRAINSTIGTALARVGRRLAKQRLHTNAVAAATHPHPPNT